MVISKKNCRRGSGFTTDKRHFRRGYFEIKPFGIRFCRDTNMPVTEFVSFYRNGTFNADSFFGSTCVLHIIESIPGNGDCNIPDKALVKDEKIWAFKNYPPIQENIPEVFFRVILMGWGVKHPDHEDLKEIFHPVLLIFLCNHKTSCLTNLFIFGHMIRADKPVGGWLRMRSICIQSDRYYWRDIFITDFQVHRCDEHSSR